MNKEYHKLIHETYDNIIIEHNSLRALPFVNIKNFTDFKNAFIYSNIETDMMFITHIPTYKYRGERNPIDFFGIRIYVDTYDRLRVRDVIWNVTYTKNQIDYISDSDINDNSVSYSLILYYTLKYMLVCTKINNYTIECDGINISIKQVIK